MVLCLVATCDSHATQALAAAGAVGQERGMATEHLVPEDIRALYHVREWRNAAGVLMTACPEEWADIVAVLRGFRLLRSEILTAGGGLSPISQQVNGAFGARG